MNRKYLMVFCFFNIFIVNANSQRNANTALDYSLYEEVLDPEECERQMYHIMNNDTMLRLQFADSSFRPPKGMLLLNFRDLGNYHQCLDINKFVDDMRIDGKYCRMHLPLQQEDIVLPNSLIDPANWVNMPWNELYNKENFMDEIFLRNMEYFDQGRRSLIDILGDSPEQSISRVAEDSELAAFEFDLALCIPKVCTTRQALDIITENQTLGLKFSETCRLPNDKPWAPVDYVAIAIFFVIGVLTILSTSFDIWYTVLEKRDPRQTNALYFSFSTFTNTRKLFTFKSNPNAISCLDGIRSFAMLWVIVGHTFVTQLTFIPANPMDIVEFMKSFSSLWITSATITVDTFFMISGLLLVYTTAAKVSQLALLKNLHLFYLNRLLRMFPVLAAGVLIQASFQNWVTDGPVWSTVAKNTDDCRQNWWSTLLYVQNFANPSNMCLSHSWYLAIDMQLYIISPVILFWVLSGNRKSAWTALIGSLLSVIIAATIYNFIMKFQSATVALSRREDTVRYMRKYYLHTLPRASPFFVGMVCGYILHLNRGKKARLPKILVYFYWTLATIVSSTVIISTYFVIQPEWNNQNVDSILNSFMRPAWAACIAWLVFACVNGFAGPINWILSLHIFKILGRLSYAMYIMHFPLIYLVNATALTPIYFSVEYSMYRFLIDLNLTIIAAVLVSVLIDLPFSVLIGMALGGSRNVKVQKPAPAVKESDFDKKISEDRNIINNDVFQKVPIASINKVQVTGL